MSTKKQPIVDTEVKIEAAIDGAESFLEKNFKNLLIAIIAIIVITGSYFGYNSFIANPKAEKAAAAMYIAEQNFQVDSFALALHGNENFDGFATIAKEHGSTSVGNIANHYAGICYLKLGDFENALTSLQSYKPVKGMAAEIINAQNIGLRGDIASESGDAATAASLYEQASAIKNDFTTPTYLKKAGIAYATLGNKEKAIALFTQVKDKYPTSVEGRDIDKFIGAIN